jgi:hypothetical protein
MAEQTTTISLFLANDATFFATFLISLGDESDVPPYFKTSFKLLYLF